MSDYSEIKGQNVFIYDRNKLNVTGVSSVDSFDESGISATTLAGERIFIEGSGITVTDVNLDNNCFEATGIINGVYYSNQQEKQVGIFERLFKKQ